MVIHTKVEIAGNEISDAKDIRLKLNQNEFNTTSNFVIQLDNVAGRHSGEFSVNDEINIYADTVDATTKLFNGVIDDVQYRGRGQTELLRLLGREYGSILMDVIVSPRIFKDTEISAIVTSLISQNVSNVTVNNVNVTSTTLDKITFTNVSVYDALRQLAELAGYYFYVDVDKDLHFEQKESLSTGETITEDITKRAQFITTDQDQATKVTVRGSRQLTASQSIQTTGTDNTGSKYTFDSKPYNVGVTLSGATNTILQPGGVKNIGDPATQNVKFLVDFQGRNVTLTSGATAGDNTQANGAVVIFDYQISTPIISIKQTPSAYPKHRVVTDLNIKDINEASAKATAILNKNKDPKTSGLIEVKGLLPLTPGNTVVVNLPNQNQINQTYAITTLDYEIDSSSTQSEDVLTVGLNKKISDFEDLFKDSILRLRALEAAEADASITSIELGNAEVEVEVSTKAISRGIGSGFYFNIPGHDVLDSTSSLLGDMRTGSTYYVDGELI